MIFMSQIRTFFREDRRKITFIFCISLRDILGVCSTQLTMKNSEEEIQLMIRVLLFYVLVVLEFSMSLLVDAYICLF